MPDGPFKSMTRDPGDNERRRRALMEGVFREGPVVRAERCESCGGFIEPGDWPFCGGVRERHVR